MRGLDISDAKFTRGGKAEHINLARKLVNLPRLTNPAFLPFPLFCRRIFIRPTRLCLKFTRKGGALAKMPAN
jgi:hypothetical protein